MFRKLRLKLTLINVSIILALFLILIVGAYFFSQLDMNRRTDMMAQNIIADVQSGRISDTPHLGVPFGIPPGQPSDSMSESPLRNPHGLPPGAMPGAPPGPPPGPNFFFVKATPSGTVTYQSAGTPLRPDRLAMLTKETLQADQSRGTILFEDTQYSYQKAPLNNQPGTLVLFHDLSQETNMRRVLLTALIVVGAICSLLSFGASFFMASRAMVPIQQAWQQQKDFLSDASHELRTPLAVIQTNLDIVRMSPDETVASQSKWLDNIQEESVNMAKLVDSLLFLARADSQQQPLAMQPFFLDTALRRAVSPFEALAAVKGLSLEVHGGENIVGYGDEARIKQVIGILLDNAIRHTPAGGKIVVSLSQAETKALLTIADSGEGIAPEYLGKIFDRFFQADKSRARGGAGLGLAIAKYIIDSHGGALTVTSTPGVGTTFKMWIPLEKGTNNSQAIENHRSYDVNR